MRVLRRLASKSAQSTPVIPLTAVPTEKLIGW